MVTRENSAIYHGFIEAVSSLEVKGKLSFALASEIVTLARRNRDAYLAGEVVGGAPLDHWIKGDVAFDNLMKVDTDTENEDDLCG